MTDFCPHYPPPQPKKLPPWRVFFAARRSWMNTLYQRSYEMQMGEVSLLGSKLFMINDPVCVRHVMQDAVNQYPKHDLLHQALAPLLGNSIFTTNGEIWSRQRQMMSPSFAQTRIDLTFAHMQAAHDAMQARISQWDMSQPHDIQEEMTLVTADVIFRTIFSQGIEEEAAREVIANFTLYQEIAPKMMIPAVFGLRWFTDWFYQRRFQDAARQIRQSLLKMIRPRFLAHQEKALSPQYSAQDILDSLMDARDESSGRAFSEEELLDQVAMLFLAGHETSASALAWGLHLLSHSPEIQKKMREEYAQVTDRGILQASHLRSLSLTQSVFRESMRLFPPVGFIARSVSQKDEIRDKNIKPGDSVVISPWLIHRHRALWDNPDSFKPDRFMRNASDTAHPSKSAFLPFGMGPRVCIGANFALQEAVLILSQLIERYEVLPCEGHVPQPVGRLTTRSENGIMVRLRKRSTEASS
jgi:cytochrome P450